MNLQNAYQAASAAASNGPPVDFERVLSALEGELSQEETLAVIDLTTEHLSWAAAWAEAKSMLAYKHEPAPAPSVAANGNRWWAAAAISMAVAAGGLLIARSTLNTPDTPVYRDAQPSTVTPDSAASMSRKAVTLSWTQPPNKARIKVLVFDDQLRPIAQSSGIGLTHYDLGEARLSQVPSGGELLWHLEILHADGNIERTPTQRVRLLD